MKRSIVAIDPLSIASAAFERFCNLIRIYQSNGLFVNVSVVSVISSSLYMVPLSWYRENEDQFALETQEKLKEACKGRFLFDDMKVLRGDGSSNEYLVERLSKYGRKVGADILLVASYDRTGLPYWIIGSFAETALLTGELSVFVVKANANKLTFSNKVSFVVGIDPLSPPAKRSLRWIATAARQSKAYTYLVYVKPRRKMIVDAIQTRKSKSEIKKVMAEAKEYVSDQNVIVETVILDENRSVAETITDFADSKKAWITMTLSSKRSSIRNLVLGSTARKIMASGQRPFLNLR